MSWIAASVRFQHLRFWLGPTALFTTQPKLQKYAYQCIFGSHGTIHTFKNYFATVFLTINFQFLANNRYPNTPLMFKFTIFYYNY